MDKKKTLIIKNCNNNPKVFYGLQKLKSNFVSNFHNNQKPNSEVEFKHKIDTKKPIINFDQNNNFFTFMNLNEEK